MSSSTSVLYVGCAGEVDFRTALGRIDADRDLDLRPVVQRQRERAVLQARDHAAYGFLGVVLHVAHVRLHDVESELLHHLAQFLHALLVGGDLRFQVGHVLLGIAARIGAAAQQREHLGLAELPSIDQFHVVDLHALFLDQGRERRHGARRRPADVRMVPA
jgi:hypothetical protein